MCKRSKSHGMRPYLPASLASAAAGLSASWQRALASVRSSRVCFSTGHRSILDQQRLYDYGSCSCKLGLVCSPISSFGCIKHLIPGCKIFLCLNQLRSVCCLQLDLNLGSIPPGLQAELGSQKKDGWMLSGSLSGRMDSVGSRSQDTCTLRWWGQVETESWEGRKAYWHQVFMKVRTAITGCKQVRYTLVLMRKTCQYFCESLNMLLLG